MGSRHSTRRASCEPLKRGSPREAVPAGALQLGGAGLLDRRVLGVASAAVAALCWSIGAVFVKMLQPYYGVHVQNFARFLSAGLFLMALYVALRGAPRGAARVAWRALPVIVVVDVFQVVLITGIFMTKASVAGFVTRLGVVTVALLAYLVYREERALIGDTRYLAGLALSLLGVAGFTLKGGLQIDVGALLIAFSTLLWAGYILLLKRQSRGLDTLLFTSILFIGGGLLFTPLALPGLRDAASAPLHAQVLLVASGIVSIGFSNWANIKAINLVGAAAPTAIQTAQPLLTAIFAYLILGETLTPWEAAAAALVLAGNALVAKATVEKAP